MSSHAQPFGNPGIVELNTHSFSSHLQAKIKHCLTSLQFKSVALQQILSPLAHYLHNVSKKV